MSLFRLVRIHGKNNKVIGIKNGKEFPLRILPRGLTVNIKGNNNICKIEFPIKFKNVFISIAGDGNRFEIKKQEESKVANTTFRVFDGGDIFVGSNCQFCSGGIYVNCNGGNSHKIHIGDNVYIAQDTLIRSGDGHTVIDTITKEPLNEPKDIIIEDNVWIGAKCTILKNAYISSGSIVGACSLVNKPFPKKNVIIAGVPAKIIKENVSWNPLHYNHYKEKFMFKD